MHWGGMVGVKWPNVTVMAPSVRTGAMMMTVMVELGASGGSGGADAGHDHGVMVKGESDGVGRMLVLELSVVVVVVVVSYFMAMVGDGRAGREERSSEEKAHPRALPLRVSYTRWSQAGSDK